MKRTCLLVLVLLSTLAGTTFADITHKVDFDRKKESSKNAQGKDGATYTILSMDKSRTAHDIGKPSLPVKYIRLIIPSAESASAIEVTKTQDEVTSVEHRILPIQKQRPTQVGTTRISLFS